MIHSLLLGTLILTHAQLDRSTPEATLRSFSGCITSQDWKGASSCVRGANPKSADSMAQMFPKNAKINIKLSDFESIPNGESEVEVSFNMWISMEAPGTEPSETTYGERVRLSKEGDGWLILPGELVKATTPLVSLASMLATDLSKMQPGVDRSQEQAQATNPSTASLVNLKQIALGMIMYATDWNDVYPKKTWKNDLLPYLKNRSILQPPKQDNSPATEYLMNAALMGKNMAKLKSPALTVLAYEARGGQVTYNHSGRAAVAFADGHVKLISPEEMKKCRWKL